MSRDVEDFASTALKQVAATSQRPVTMGAVEYKMRTRRRVRLLSPVLAAALVVGVAITVVAVEPSGRTSSRQPGAPGVSESHSLSTFPSTGALPPGSTIPHGCDHAITGLPRGPVNAAQQAPAAHATTISRLQAICLAEQDSIDGSRTHPAWAWLTTRAVVVTLGWDGCACNNRDRQVWVISIDGPAKTDGSPSTAPTLKQGYALILDAATGQGTDAVIGLLQLQGGREVDLNAH